MGRGLCSRYVVLHSLRDHFAVKGLEGCVCEKLGKESMGSG